MPKCKLSLCVLTFRKYIIPNSSVFVNTIPENNAEKKGTPQGILSLVKG